MAQLPDPVLFEFPDLKFCVSSLQVGSQVAGKMQLGQKKSVHGISRACIKHVTCWMRFVYCNFGASWFDLWTLVRMRHGPKPVPGHYQVCKRNCKSLREGWLAVQNLTFLKLAPKKYAGNIPQGYPIVTRKPTHLLASPNWRQCGWMVKFMWNKCAAIHHDMPHVHPFAWLLIWRPSLRYIQWQISLQIRKAKSIYLPWMGRWVVYLTISHCFWLLQSIFCINWWLEVVSCHCSRHSIVRNSQHHHS